MDENRSHNGWIFMLGYRLQLFQMNSCSEETMVLQYPKKNFSIKKHVKLVSINASIPTTPLPASEPVSPFKLISNEEKTSRNPQRFFHDGMHKNSITPQPRHLLPALIRESTNQKRSQSPNPKSNKYLMPVKGTLNHNPQIKSEEIYLNDFLNNDQSEEPSFLSKRYSKKAKQEAITIDIQQPSLRMKPFIIQNKLVSKFGLSKPGSQQARNSKRKTKLRNTNQNPQLFTFYPKHQQSDNEFLDPTN